MFALAPGVFTWRCKPAEERALTFFRGRGKADDPHEHLKARHFEALSRHLWQDRGRGEDKSDPMLHKGMAPRQIGSWRSTRRFYNACSELD